jgi:hypothetical protein
LKIKVAKWGTPKINTYKNKIINKTQNRGRPLGLCPKSIDPPGAWQKFELPPWIFNLGHLLFEQK